MTGPAYDCGSRIPPSIRDRVPLAPLPDGTQGGLGVAFNTQTDRVVQANDEKDTSLWIVDNCEKEKTATVEALTRRSLWQKLTPWRE